MRIGELEVERLGFGAMHLRPESSRALLRRAVELGVTLIDTADVYGNGQSERLIAQSLHPYPAGLVIATKAGLINDGSQSWPRDGRREHLREAVDGSLSRLRLDRIDLLQLHRVDERVRIEESVGALAELQKEGKIRHIGLSNVTVEQLHAAQAVAEIVSVQNCFSREQHDDDPAVDECERQGIGFLPWGPLGGESPVEAIQWLLARSPVICPIPGTSSIEHLEENMTARAA